MQMLSEKTVVYITHQLEFLGAADVVLVTVIAISVNSLMNQLFLIFFFIENSGVLYYIISTGDERWKNYSVRKI